MSQFNFNDVIEWGALNETEREEILRRPAVMAGDRIKTVVEGILEAVRERGDEALREFSAKFDRTEVKDFRVSAEEVDAAVARLPEDFMAALKTAAANIEKFHSAEVLEPVTVETMPGVVCQQVTRPIGAVGLYIPGGTAPLFSTVLMLGIPAKIAGCGRVILCSPPPIADPILAAARLCGIDEIYQVGGAQAVAAMAFGTATIPRVGKIFGPGNAYVTEAKRQVSSRPDGAAIDMPAGPSEVLVIADEGADPRLRCGRPALSGRTRSRQPGGARDALAQARRSRCGRGRLPARRPAAPRDRDEGPVCEPPHPRQGPRGVRGGLEPLRARTPHHPDAKRPRSGAARAERGLRLRGRLVSRVGRRLRHGHEPRSSDLRLCRHVLEPRARRLHEAHDRSGNDAAGL